MAEITVSSFEIPGLQFAGVEAGELRLYASRTFLDSDGEIHLGGAEGDQQGFYQACPFTVADDIITVASFVTVSTLDAQDNAPSTILITGALFSADGQFLQNLFSGWQIPSTSPTTFAALYNLNRSVYLPIAPDAYLTRAAVLDLIETALGERDYASDVIAGVTYLTAAPVSPILPLAVGKNDYAGLSNNGVTALTVAPASASIPLAVGDNDNTRIPPRTGPRSVIANGYAGADVGAQINAADAALGSDQGEIWVFGGGNIATQVVISAGHTLVLKGGGTYTATTNGCVVRLKNGSGIRADDWGAVLEESTGSAGVSSPFNVIGAYNGLSADSLSGASASNITIEGVHIRGARSDFDSAHPTISTENAQGAKVIGCWLESTRSIGINAGGGANSGNYGRDVLIAHNLLTETAFIPISLVNANDVIIDANIIRKPHQIGAPISVGIDIEPNVGAHARSIHITNNLIDASDTTANLLNDGIAVQNTQGITDFGPIVVAGNTIIGATHATLLSNAIPGAGIYVNQAADVHLVSNLIQRANRGIMLLNATNCEVKDNRLSSTGSGSTYAFEITNTTHTNVSDNLLYDFYGDALALGAIATDIVESGTSDFNTFVSNPGAVVATVGASSTLSTPRPYRVYSALLTQSSTAAPAATVLENNLGGTPAFARTALGTYTITLSGAFTANKTAVFIGGMPAAIAGGQFLGTDRTSANVLTLKTGYVDLIGIGTQALSDDILAGTPIEIRVYQ